MPDAAGTTLKPCGASSTTSSSEQVPGEHIGQRQARREPQEYVDVGEAEVAVEQHDFLAARRERGGEVHGDRGLAHATLAAGDGDHLDRIRVGGA